MRKHLGTTMPPPGGRRRGDHPGRDTSLSGSESDLEAGKIVKRQQAAMACMSSAMRARCRRCKSCRAVARDSRKVAASIRIAQLSAARLGVPSARR